MPKFAANLTWLFNEFEFLDRFAEARRAGFDAVEILFPYAFDPRDVKERLKANDLTQVVINVPPGDWDAGERGLAIFPDRRDEFRSAVEQAISYASELSCKQLHCMAGVFPDEADLFEIEATYIGNLKFATAEAAKAGININIEAVNTTDVPGYYLTYVEQAADVIEKVGADNLRLQFDFYNVQKMEGNLAVTFETYLPLIGHVQIADNPGRHEPGTGEINYSFILAMLDRLGYSGWVGCEYGPKGTTLEGLSWMERLGK
ncbi:MAG: 2-oxo-tetronate isomerase [Pseudomonadota bacterium]